MGKEIVTFGKIEIEKYKLHQRKNPISIYDMDVDRKVVPSGFLSVKKL